MQHIGAPGGVEVPSGLRFRRSWACDSCSQPPLQPHVGEAAAHQHGGGTDDGGAPHVEQFLRAAWGVATVVGVDAPAAKHPASIWRRMRSWLRVRRLFWSGSQAELAAFGFVVEGGFKASIWRKRRAASLAALGVGVAGGGQGAAIDGGCGAALAPNDFRHLIPATNGLQQSALPLGVEVLAQRLVVANACCVRCTQAFSAWARRACAARLRGGRRGAALLVAGIGFFRRLGGFHLPHVIAQQPYVDAAALIQSLPGATLGGLAVCAATGQTSAQRTVVNRCFRSTSVV